MVRQFNLATPHHAHVSPLHHQAARGRHIIVTEDPNLHLVWYYDKIFVKPIPRYMFSHAFWEYIRNVDAEMWKACAGFMRSYSHLIQFDIDFRRAIELGLMPAANTQHPITYSKYAAFIHPFAQLPDTTVNARYEYGELRLTRLNVLAPFCIFRLSYFHIEAQWRTYLGQFFAPILTVFVLITTTLNAMQVQLTAQTLQELRNWYFFTNICPWFSIAVVVLILATVVLFIFIVIVMFVHDYCFAREVKRRKKGDIQQAAFIKSCVI